MFDDLVDLDTLSERLDVPFGWLQKEFLNGGIPALKMDDVYRFNPSKVRTVLAARATQTRTPEEDSDV